MMKERIQQVKNYLEQSSFTVFFGGAGVSTASGIPDFRSADGLYSQKLGPLSPETLLSASFFRHHPGDFYDFYKSRMVFMDAKPNAAHVGLAKLESMGKLQAVITQNIDALHQKAGSTKVYELHGSIYRNHCVKCHASYEIDTIIHSTGIPLCSKCQGIIKPDVVLYEESLDPDTIHQAIEAIQQAELLIIGGTSLSVYPAASFLNYFTGKDVVLINKTPTTADKDASVVFRENISSVFEELLREF